MSLDMMLFVGRIDVFREQGIDVVLDRVQSAGIRALVLGDLVLDGSPAFDPEPSYYSEVDFQPSPVDEEARPKAEVFCRAVERSKARGLELYLHDWGQGAAGRAMTDPAALAYGLARTRDVKRAFPQISGYVLDGPEFGYEIEPDHRSALLGRLDDATLERAGSAGYDIGAMDRDREWLSALLRRLDPVSARRWLRTESAVTDTLDLLMSHPGLLESLRFRSDSILGLLRSYADGVKAIDPALALGCGPRISAFAPLTGYAYGPLAQIVDFFCPKVYLWHEGIDGLKGTVGRYAKTLTQWNPTLPESLAIALVTKAFGLPLPGMDTVADLDNPLAPEFFDRTLASEIDKVVLRAGDVSKIRLFMGLHHGGVHMSTEEMKRILAVVQESPCDKVIYWEYGDITDEQWTVLEAYA